MSLTGIPFWCVSVEIIAAGELVLGIIYDPLVGELYSARKDGGALMNGHPMRVSGETDLIRTRIRVDSASAAST